jgi:hypothetical protein
MKTDELRIDLLHLKLFMSEERFPIADDSTEHSARSAGRYVIGALITPVKLGPNRRVRFKGKGNSLLLQKNFRKEGFCSSSKKGEVREFAMIDFILWLVYVSYASQFREHMVTGKGQRAFIFAPNRTMCQGSFI